MKYSGISALAFAAAASAQLTAETCPSGVVVAPTAVEYPVYISTYIAANTVFNINGNANITINNAPTTLEILTTATSTVFNTVTDTTTTTAAPVATATTVDTPILLGISTPVTKKNKRQGFSGFLGASASVAASCQAAESFTLSAGSFFVAGSTSQFSTAPGFTSIEFAASDSVGSITTTFGLSAEGFVWQNSAFVGGQALFFLSTAGTIEASFSGAIPSGSTVITLTAILASSCPGYGGANSTSVTSSASMTSMTSTSSLSPSASSASSSLSSVQSSLSSVASSIASSISSVASSASSAAASLTASANSTSSSSTGSSTTASSTPTGTPVTVSFSNPTNQKRDAQGTTEYITAEGTFTDDASLAAVFTLTPEGQLFSGATAFNAGSDQAYEQFYAGAGTGDIETTFTMDSGVLTWTNSSFSIDTANTAVFAVSSSTIFAAFQTIPAGAATVALSASVVTTSSVSSSATASSVSGTTVSESATAASGTSASASATATSSSASITSSSTSSSVGNLSTGLSAATSAVGAVKRYNIPHENVRHRV